jgi:predicted ATP-dependent endonuclease of OLD family
MAGTGQAQVIYSTHSPVFAEAYRFESLRILRRAHGGYSSVFAADTAARAAFDADRNKLLANYDASRSEALFADGVLLVEGPGDQLAARQVASSLAIDLDAENLSVISCGGKTAIPYHARLCKALGIPVCALYDDDLVADPSEDDTSSSARKARENNQRARRETREIENALPSSLDRFACSPNLESELGVSDRGKDKPARVLAAVRERPEGVPAALRNAVLRLGDLTDSAPPPF